MNTIPKPAAQSSPGTLAGIAINDSGISVTNIYSTKKMIIVMCHVSCVT